MTDTETDKWPTPDADTGVLYRERDTLVGGTPPPGGPPPPAPPGPDNRFGAGLLLGILVLALAAAGVAIAYFLTHRDASAQPVTTTVVRSTAPKRVVTKKVAVPRVVGLKEQPALLRLAQLGLRPKEVYRPTRQPKGIVVSQRPKEATEVKKGSQVRIVIDSGAPQVKVPDLSGKSFADARAALDKLGLDSTRTQVTSSKPAGTVVDQAPKPGKKLAKGSSVTLSVAKPKPPAPTTTAQAGTTTEQQTTTAPTTTAAAPTQPRNATMPNVTQQTEASAVQAMSDAGILPSIVFIPGDDPLGTVEQQAKSAGATVPYHAHVQINVSSGPGDKPQMQVPNVIGQTLQQAVGSLNGAHLRLLYVKYPVYARSKAGRIVQQSPLGGGKVPQNGQVLVFVGAFQG